MLYLLMISLSSQVLYRTDVNCQVGKASYKKDGECNDTVSDMICVTFPPGLFLFSFACASQGRSGLGFQNPSWSKDTKNQCEFRLAIPLLGETLHRN